MQLGGNLPVGADAVVNGRRSEVFSRAVRAGRRRWQRAAPVLAAAAAQASAWTRARLWPWLRHKLAVERARLRCWRAALAHEASLLRCHARLAWQRWAYRLRCRTAERAVGATEREAARLVEQASERFRALCRPQRLARYGPYALLDDGLVGPDWDVSLASVRAVVVPPDAVALKGGGTAAFPVPHTEAGEKRGRLLIRSRRGLSMHDCSAEDARAGEFARLVNVAALNPGSLQEPRREQLQQAAEHLEAVRARSAGQIADARAALEAVRADTARVDEARHLLLRAQRDTRERDRRRAALAAIREHAPGS